VSARNESIYEKAGPNRPAMVLFPGIIECDNADTHTPIISRSRRRRCGVDRRLIGAAGGSHPPGSVNESGVNLRRARNVGLRLAAFLAEHHAHGIHRRGHLQLG
jgi:hypothetical protein